MTKTAVITGAGGVLCSAFAKALAADGYAVALLDLNLKAAKQVEAEIQANGGEALALQADVLDRSSLEDAARAVEARFGGWSVLINGAGGNHPRGTTSMETFSPEMEEGEGITTFFDLQPENIRFVFDLNLLGAVLTTQVFARPMTKTGGSILNISSMNAFRPLTKIPAYSAAKAAVSNFTEWLAVHFAPCGIRVNAIAPGFFVTAQNYALLYDEAGNPTARTQKILSQTPMGRFGKPEELCGALRWLVDEEASGFVTGIVVPVDGGFSAYSGV